MGICVPSTTPRHRGKPLFCSNFCMISAAHSPCGHRMKVFAQLSTSALQTLLTMRYTEDFVTLKRSDTDPKHSGLPSTQRVKSNCFSTLTGGLPLLCTVGIQGKLQEAWSPFLHFVLTGENEIGKLNLCN